MYSSTLKTPGPVLFLFFVFLLSVPTCSPYLQVMAPSQTRLPGQVYTEYKKSSWVTSIMTHIATGNRQLSATRCWIKETWVVTRVLWLFSQVTALGEGCTSMPLWTVYVCMGRSAQCDFCCHGCLWVSWYSQQVFRCFVLFVSCLLIYSL